MTNTGAKAYTAAVALTVGLTAASCEKTNPPAAKGGAEPPTKTIVMPVKPLTDAEKTMLLKATKDFVDAARAKEPLAYADIDWRRVEYKRMGVYFHVTAEKAGFNPHAKGISRSYVFRVDRDMKKVVDLDVLKAAEAAAETQDRNE